MSFNIDEISGTIAEKTGISTDIVKKVLEAVQHSGGGILGGITKMFGKKDDAVDKASEIAEKANVPKEQVSKILDSLKELTGKLPFGDK